MSNHYMNIIQVILRELCLFKAHLALPHITNDFASFIKLP